MSSCAVSYKPGTVLWSAAGPISVRGALVAPRRALICCEMCADTSGAEVCGRRCRAGVQEGCRSRWGALVLEEVMISSQTHEIATHEGRDVHVRGTGSQECHGGQKGTDLLQLLQGHK